MLSDSKPPDSGGFCVGWGHESVVRGRSPAPMSACWPEDTDFPEAYLRRSRASPEVTLGSDAPAPVREASSEDSPRRRRQLRRACRSPEERAQIKTTRSHGWF